MYIIIIISVNIYNYNVNIYKCTVTAFVLVFKELIDLNYSIQLIERPLKSNNNSPHSGIT